jgi:Heterokaryon incompatibility protein (HET)
MTSKAKWHRSRQLRPYRYPWTVAEHSVRLITLCPANLLEPAIIEVLILTFPLDGLPRYNALSYTPGPPEAGMKDYTAKDRVPILVNGLRFYVLPNLYDALVQLRETCINQSDLEERASQAGIMDQIYRNAARVVVWLGKTRGSARHIWGLLDQIQQIPSVAYVDMIAGITQPSSRSLSCDDTLNDPVVAQYRLPPLDTAIWDLAYHFFQRRWFTRLWIIPEIAMAREVVVLCDSHTIPWTAMLRCGQILHERRMGFAEDLKWSVATKDIVKAGLQRSSKIRCDGAPRQAPFATTLGSIMIARAWLQSDENIPSLNLGESPIAKYSAFSEVPEDEVRALTGCRELSATAILFYLMWQNKQLSATDCRDKIYALLGLVNGISRTKGLATIDILPDYSDNSSFAAMLRRVCEQILRESGKLTLLGAAPPASQRGLHGLPSWVPDFSGVEGCWDFQQDILMVKPPFTAAEPDTWPKTKPLFTTNGLKLGVHALGLGKIKRICDLDGGTNLWDSWPKWTVASDLLGEVKDPYPYSGEPRLFAFWRTMALNSERGQRPADTSLGAAFGHMVYEAVYAQCDVVRRRGQRALYDFLHSLEDFNFLSDCEGELRFVQNSVHNARLADSVSWEATVGVPPCLYDLMRCSSRQSERFRDEVDGTFTHRQVFLTDSGLLGLAQVGAREGDNVCVVAGCPCPLILREGPDARVGVRLVSVAYVHGLMDGEQVGAALRGGEEWEEIWLE